MTRDNNSAGTTSFITLTRLILFANAVSGVLRVSGAFAQKDLLLEFGLPAWLPAYLVAVGGMSALLSLFGLACTWLKGRLRVSAVWSALLFTVISYWVERLFLWAPEQRGGNPLFKLTVHALSLAAAAGYTYYIKKETQSIHGPGN
ncbi:MAG: hypothetical protein GX415_05090 [Chloroflexi bacterium]|jgi:hypothetical protein|nr:hypothetical protein [Anaerolineaceae bacterium]NLI44770.1 hypothetical protein [Chloroflexota bacterium]HOE35224.1 hypothetical protein [Anaerolineaceae bacterium]HOT25556.1 hypothetical protein [Anaerolineaceae bacterium]HQK03448.1 hypothetical protein [Anaerolineaceae bacterium]